MKKTRSSGRGAVAVAPICRLIACLVLYAVVCSPAVRVVAEIPSTAGLIGGSPAPRQVAHFRVDRTFNSSGFMTDRFVAGNDSVAGAFMQPDGKTLVGVGWSGASFGGFEVIRLNADGTRDMTFGIGCKLTAPFGSISSSPLFAIQPDGKIIVRGITSNVMRCNPDGSRDASFGVNGIQQTNFNFGGSIALLSDGKILIGGQNSGNFSVARLNADGTADTTFDGDGIASAAFPSLSLGSIAVQPDGKIVAAGSSAGDFALARFNADGSLDTSFDGDGKLTTAIFAGNESANEVVIQPDGKILAAGFSLNSPLSTSGVFALVRYNPDGSLDTSFDGDGKVATPVVNTGTVMLASHIEALTLQPDGKILAAGRSHNGWNYDNSMARYNADGSLDTTFGVGGFVVPPFPSAIDHKDDLMSVLLIRPDGKILAGGDIYNWHGGRDISFHQFNADGTADTSFGTGGKVVMDVGSNTTYGTAVAIQPDGKILVAGRSVISNNGGEVTAIARYNPDGTRDASFNGNGLMRHSFAFPRLAVDPNGKILIAGGGPLFRYNSDGTPDTSFDGDGRLDGVNSGGSLVFQPDGKLLIRTSNAITRLASDGALDTTFAGDGTAAVAFEGGSLKLLPDGKIVTAGTTNSDFAVARFNANGSLDTTFDGDGITTTNISGSDSLFDVSVQPDGKIVAAGRANGQFDAAFVRYNTDGSLDASFGINGKTILPNVQTDFPHVTIRPDGKIVAVSVGSGSLDFIRLTAGGLADGSFYSDGKANFSNTKYSSNPVPFISVIAFDAQGRIIQVGSNSPPPSSTDFRSLFVGRMEITDHGYVHFDHNGDGKADLAVFRPSNRNWLVLTPEGFTTTAFGDPGDRPVPADYDGDGITDIAVFRGSVWRVRNSETQTVTGRSTGLIDGSNPAPLPSDRDGDGYDDRVFYRFDPTILCQTLFSVGPPVYVSLGVAGDKPVRGDFDGDGRSEIALYRPSNQNWYILSSSYSQGFYAVEWGADGDVPVPADYDGDGTTDFAVWRPSTGQWWILGSTAGWMTANVWGEPTDKPVPADYDGDGKTDVAVWRPSTGTWYIINSADSSIRVQQFGQDGDIPLPSAFIY